ncbi:MAG: HIT family protein [Candidatus Liptonbacteria bacterium]
MENCIFCRLVAKEIPCVSIYETAQALAFLDIHPRAVGHTMVIPKVHAATLTDLSESEITPLFSVVKKVAQKIQTALRPDGMTIGINQGEASGQTIPHLHVHIIPRFKDDGGGSIHSVVDNPPREELNVIAEKLKIN